MNQLDLITDTIWGIFTQPRKAFREILEHPEFDRQYFWGAVAVVTLASLIDGLTVPSVVDPGWMFFSLFVSLIVGFARWFFLAALAALTVTLFGAHMSRIAVCLITTGWAFLPGILLAPLGCYRLLLGPLYPVLSISILLWVIALEWIAIQETYKLRGMEMYCLVFAVPSLFFFTQLFWIWPFVSEILKASIS
ncbi:MAG: YIP1 family protein [Candidatus Obscuribacterales bacterium]|nr:YIP1 family protein [Candidatus Obscuribacterales bacterium]